MQGKGKTERTVFLSADARPRWPTTWSGNDPVMPTTQATALFLSAVSLPARAR